MSNYPEHVNIKLSAEVMDKVERYRVELQEQMRQPVNRSAALRMLIVCGLEAEERRKPIKF